MTAASLRDIRAERLSKGLIGFGIGEGSAVVVLCCDHHAVDRAVAVQALAALGATAIEPTDWETSTLASLAGRNPVMELACQEGVLAWRAIGGRGIMIGEAEGAGGRRSSAATPRPERSL